MNNIISLESIAKSKAAANRAVKTMSVEQVERALHNLSAAAEKIKQQESVRAQRKKEMAVKKLKSMMDELGISPDDIVGNTKKVAGKKRSAGPRKGNKVAPKYQLTVDGTTHQWTGRGRTPVVFKVHVANGASLDECLI